ncbi:MAG: disulfide bond formation protein B, partial [Methylocystis sp.]
MFGSRMALLESSGLLAPRNIALLILAAAVAAIGGAFAYESLGYLPCELCYKERAPYYAAFALAPLAAFAAQTGRGGMARAAFLLMALLFAGNAI